LFLATCPDESLRDPAAAVRLADKGDALICGIEGMCMGALGIAQYRLGDDRAAVASLELAPRLRDHPHPEQLFYRAAARWRLGRKDRARRDYDEAVRLMAFYDDDWSELTQFRAEAAAVLGIRDEGVSDRVLRGK